MEKGKAVITPIELTIILTLVFGGAKIWFLQEAQNKIADKIHALKQKEESKVANVSIDVSPTVNGKLIKKNSAIKIGGKRVVVKDSDVNSDVRGDCRPNQATEKPTPDSDGKPVR